MFFAPPCGSLLPVRRRNSTRSEVLSRKNEAFDFRPHPRPRPRTRCRTRCWALGRTLRRAVCGVLCWTGGWAGHGTGRGSARQAARFQSSGGAAAAVEAVGRQHSGVETPHEHLPVGERGCGVGFAVGPFVGRGVGLLVGSGRIILTHRVATVSWGGPRVWSSRNRWTTTAPTTTSNSS